ncbi:MAG: nicotinate phosphoribosyltransferase [Bryobacterales bacterium]|nr:nicotinate phosphoribosyltransferase [Bryobacterales bacterium]MBV9400341.1 nicotinate phosphoribosyltransferase [Bryobacterales bacterium]
MSYGLLTDFYQLTMAAGYFEAGKARERATFELFIRKLPWNRNFVLVAGLPQIAEYLLNLSFSKEEIDYLRGLPQFEHTHPGFFDMLAELRFTGDLFAVPEGTPMFGGEPMLTVRAPLIEAQIAETYLLSMIGFQSMIATKAARVVKAALGRQVVEFGTRRAHSPEAGVLAGRAGYIGGCAGTSNAAAGMRFDVPVFGTTAHSWIMAFPHERDSFEQLQRLLGESTVYLIDSYDTLEGARRAAALGRPLWGVRLDSGNLTELAPAVRKILDDAGLTDAKIMATGDLNEYKIHELIAARAPIDMFGVGTELSTSADAPSLGVVYKLVELESEESGRRYTFKLSEDKATLPGAKQVFRFADHDVLGRSTECLGCTGVERSPAEALLRPVMLGGKLIEPLPSTNEARHHAADCLAMLPAPCHSLFESHAWRVELSSELKSLTERVQQEAS